MFLWNLYALLIQLFFSYILMWFNDIKKINLENCLTGIMIKSRENDMEFYNTVTAYVPFSQLTLSKLKLHEVFNSFMGVWRWCETGESVDNFPYNTLVSDSSSNRLEEGVTAIVLVRLIRYIREIMNYPLHNEINFGDVFMCEIIPLLRIHVGKLYLFE